MNIHSPSYIFGPVPSRRLGRSLGIDLVPAKTCSFDCIYCQAGRTTCKTIERKEWVSLEGVLAELPEKLACLPDYITLSGSGEPTLFSRIHELIDGIKALCDIPVAIITNSSLLWQNKVRSELLQADLILPSLDAGSKKVFEQINRPHPEITFKRVLDGLVRLRREYHGDYWLEVFILRGINTSPEELAHLSESIDKIQPDRIQLNTVTRPPTEETALAVDRQQLEDIADRWSELGLSGRVEIIADRTGPTQEGNFKERTGSTQEENFKEHTGPTQEGNFKGHNEDMQAGKFEGRNEDILALLQRRPCTIGDIARGLGMHINEVVKYVESMVAKGEIVENRVKSDVFYQIRS